MEEENKQIAYLMEQLLRPWLDNSAGLRRQEEKKGKTRTEQEYNKWYFPETRSKRMSKIGVEPDWFNTSQGST